jgi:hypothetical protein
LKYHAEIGQDARGIGFVIEPEYRDGAAIGREQAGGNLEQGGLAGPLSMIIIPAYLR